MRTLAGRLRRRDVRSRPRCGGRRRGAPHDHEPGSAPRHHRRDRRHQPGHGRARPLGGRHGVHHEAVQGQRHRDRGQPGPARVAPRTTSALAFSARWRSSCASARIAIPLTGLWNRTRFVRGLEQRLNACSAPRVPSLVARPRSLQDDQRRAAATAPATTPCAGRPGSCGRRCAMETSSARTGGDEFALLLPHVVPGLAERIGRPADRAVVGPGRRAARWARASVSPPSGPTSASSPEDLLGAAGHALHAAEGGGPRPLRALHGPHGVEPDLDGPHPAAALREDRFVAFTQPILDLRTDEVIGEELLVRMRDENGEPGPSWSLPAHRRTLRADHRDRCVDDGASARVRRRWPPGQSEPLGTDAGGGSLRRDHRAPRRVRATCACCTVEIAGDQPRLEARHLP